MQNKCVFLMQQEHLGLVRELTKKRKKNTVKLKEKQRMRRTASKYCSVSRLDLNRENHKHQFSKWQLFRRSQ